MASTEVFKLWFDDSNPQAAMCTEVDLNGVSEYFIYHPEPVYDWQEKVTFYSRGKHFEDYLFATVVDWILVTGQVKQTLEELRIDGVQCLPVRVIREETGEEIRSYYVLHVWQQISALDEDHTVFREPKSTRYPQLSIVKLALKREAIGDAEVFRIEERNVSVFVSRRVKERLEYERVTGFKWVPVPSY